MPVVLLLQFWLTQDARAAGALADTIRAIAARQMHTALRFIVLPPIQIEPRECRRGRT